MNLQITPATQEDADFIENRLVAFNRECVPFTQKKTPIFMNYVIKEGDEIISGITAVMYHWGMVAIDILFVDEKHRGKKLGSLLLKKVEEEAKVQGATLVHLDTFDFQAKDFYLQHGYEIFGVLEDCPKGHKRYYMKKAL